MKNDPNSVDHRFELVEGAFDMNSGRLVCVQKRKYSEVRLCFSGQMNIPFATIKLYDGQRAKDAGCSFRRCGQTWRRNRASMESGSVKPF